MPVLQILILIFFMVVIPLALGAGITAFLHKEERNLCLMWVAGYMLMFAMFQIIAVPMILKMCSLTLLVQVFCIVSISAAVAGGALWFVKVGKKPALIVVTEKDRKERITGIVLWSVFGALLLGQLLAAVFLAFGDGDDSYYVAAATVADSSDKMYRILPYTGGSSGVDIRHILAPLPMFVAFLSRVAHVHAAIVSHVVMQLFLIPLTYGVYGLLANKLFKGKKNSVAIFLVFASVAIMWGNYSIYTAETFLLTRTRQGKAAVANLVIPMLILLMYMLGERLAENKKIEKGLWVLVFATVTVASLCSAFGGFLVILLLGVTGLCMLIAYKRWSLIIPFGISVLPAITYSLLYVILR